MDTMHHMQMCFGMVVLFGVQRLRYNTRVLQMEAQNPYRSVKTKKHFRGIQVATQLVSLIILELHINMSQSADR